VGRYTGLHAGRFAASYVRRYVMCGVMRKHKVGVFLVRHKPHKFEMDLGRLALASEVTGSSCRRTYLTILERAAHGRPILKWYGMSSCNL
jgi:hypothetical protein